MFVDIIKSSNNKHKFVKIWGILKAKHSCFQSKNKLDLGSITDLGIFWNEVTPPPPKQNLGTFWTWESFETDWPHTILQTIGMGIGHVGYAENHKNEKIVYG